MRLILTTKPESEKEVESIKIIEITEICFKKIQTTEDIECWDINIYDKDTLIETGITTSFNVQLISGALQKEQCVHLLKKGQDFLFTSRTYIGDNNE